MKKNIDLNDCISICSDLELSNIVITDAYIFSKMIIVDEMNNKEKYDNMLLVEFLEFICRIAYAKYKDVNISFLEKVERILDLIFKQIKAKRIRPNFDISVSSESDYSSDD